MPASISAAHPLDLQRVGLSPAGGVYRNLPVAALVEASVRHGVARLGACGQLVVETAPYTGRSPNDKFTVREPSSEQLVDWGAVNRPISLAHFAALHDKVSAYLESRPIYVQDAFACAAKRRRTGVRLVTDSPWHALFGHHMFIRPTREELANFEPDWTILHAPGLVADPATDGTNSGAFIVAHLGRKLVLIGGTRYAGEIKKSIFGALNYELPLQGVMTMHCSANKERDGSNVALFFGLSGTGKTTLSSDPQRMLIGDDEHGWDDEGVFNFEGGCYAKMIRLSKDAEPEIWHGVHQFGALLENVVLDPLDRTIRFEDGSITENTRGAYPVTFLRNMDPAGTGDHPRHVVLLTCDAFGVLPPIARLRPEQTLYHFLSGYTAKVAGTERGVTEPRATFSACFGAPFLPLKPTRYAQLLGERLQRHGVQAWLVNTGWTGGPFGVGHRISIAHTRRLVRAALGGELDAVAYRTDPVFGLAVPERVDGVPSDVLMPRSTWADAVCYDRKAAELARLFVENFRRFEADVDEAVRASGPKCAGC